MQNRAPVNSPSSTMVITAITANHAQRVAKQKYLRSGNPTADIQKQLPVFLKGIDYRLLLCGISNEAKRAMLHAWINQPNIQQEFSAQIKLLINSKLPGAEKNKVISHFCKEFESLLLKIDDDEIMLQLRNSIYAPRGGHIFYRCLENNYSLSQYIKQARELLEDHPECRQAMQAWKPTIYYDHAKMLDAVAQMSLVFLLGNLLRMIADFFWPDFNLLDYALEISIVYKLLCLTMVYQMLCLYKNHKMPTLQVKSDTEIKEDFYNAIIEYIKEKPQEEPYFYATFAGMKPERQKSLPLPLEGESESEDVDPSSEKQKRNSVEEVKSVSAAEAPQEEKYRDIMCNKSKYRPLRDGRYLRLKFTELDSVFKQLDGVATNQEGGLDTLYNYTENERKIDATHLTREKSNRSSVYYKMDGKMRFSFSGRLATQIRMPTAEERAAGIMEEVHSPKILLEHAGGKKYRSVRF